MIRPRMPSLDHGLVSFLWAFGLGLYLFLGMLAIEVSGATALIFSFLAGGAIFFFVRLYGQEQPRRRRQPTNSSGRPR
jgi:hypothetical protein